VAAGVIDWIVQYENAGDIKIVRNDPATTTTSKQAPDEISSCSTTTASLQHTFTGQKVEFAAAAPVPLADDAFVVWYNTKDEGTAGTVNFLI